MNVVITNEQAIKSFISQLKGCLKASKHNRGGYTASVDHRHGTLHVEVCIPMPSK